MIHRKANSNQLTNLFLTNEHRLVEVIHFTCVGILNERFETELCILNEFYLPHVQSEALQ